MAFDSTRVTDRRESVSALRRKHAAEVRQNIKEIRYEYYTNSCPRYGQAKPVRWAIRYRSGRHSSRGTGCDWRKIGTVQSARDSRADDFRTTGRENQHR